MSVYAIVSKNNKVKEAPVNLVTRYKDVGGFHTLTDEQRKEHGWFPCTVIGENYDPVTQYRSEPQYHFDGEHVTVTYVVTDKPSEVIIREASDSIRAKRDAKLASSDWTQVADAQVDKEAWADYRKALREITDQTGFPLDVKWPAAPVDDSLNNIEMP